MFIYIDIYIHRYVYIYMTVFKNLCVRLLLKISASRYPSRNLRVTFASADFLTKSRIVHFPDLWKQLETRHCGQHARHWLSRYRAADLRIVTHSIFI